MPLYSPHVLKRFDVTLQLVEALGLAVSVVAVIRMFGVGPRKIVWLMTMDITIENVSATLPGNVPVLGAWYHVTGGMLISGGLEEALV